jgi:acetoin utilization deacetylase AcuC-like enzyme
MNLPARDRVAVWFADAYAVNESPSLERLAIAAEEFDKSGLVGWRAPAALDLTTLDGLHDPTYLRAFACGEEPLASSLGVPWSPALRDAFYAMLSGQLESSHHAMLHGVSMNLARGFHHAVRHRGAGFCALNGLALVAHRWQDRRVLVIDCDEHGGNGTEEFAAELPNLYCASLFGTRFGCRGGVRSWAWQLQDAGRHFDRYLAALEEVAALVESLGPDLILYQAGVDCHVRDPKSLVGLSTEQLIERDRFVCRLAAERRIPINASIGGGYQRPDRVAALNLNTLRCVAEVAHLYARSESAVD